jgi:hypothetical protein
MQLSADERRILEQAADILEHPGFAHRLTKTVGSGVEKVLFILPSQFTGSLVAVTRYALEKSWEGALLTLRRPQKPRAFNKTHQFLAGLSGAVGGSFGLAALAVELPVSTTIMLRSIAEIAHSYGEDVTTPETKLACLQVFAFSPSDSSETGYYALRSLMAKSLSDAAAQLASKGLGAESPPALLKLFNLIAARFSIPLSEKLAAQTLPALGAVGGASINLLFIRYFQNIARAHFAIRSLERKYSPQFIQHHYRHILQRTTGRKA